MRSCWPSTIGWRSEMVRITNQILVPKTRDEALASVATMPPEVHQGLDAVVGGAGVKGPP